MNIASWLSRIWKGEQQHNSPRISVVIRNEDAELAELAALIESDQITEETMGRMAQLLGQSDPAAAASPQKEYAEAGFLLTYGADIRDLYRRSAFLVDKIFKGARPADLPVEQPTKFELVINLKTAKALGLEIPLSLLTRADEMIE